MRNIKIQKSYKLRIFDTKDKVVQFKYEETTNNLFSPPNRIY